LDGEGHLLALFGTPALEGRGGANGGVKGDIVGLAIGRTRLDVTPALALGMGAGAASSMVAG
jgi:hypothetical protein